MASFQGLSALRSISNESEKYGKPKHKVVKPILKKLSQSEKSSIDLDRSWEEQDEQYRSDVWGGSSFYESGALRSGSSKDVSFAYTEASGGGGRRYHHSRSISGNSHISVATSASGSGLAIRNGTTFVHPFQQMPLRTATPPLTMPYANSLASFADRDYSPTITEDDDSYDVDPISSHISLSLHNHSNSNSNSNGNNTHNSSHNQSSNTHSQQHQHHSPTANSNPQACSQPTLISPSSQPQRPSLASQRTSSYSDSTKSHAHSHAHSTPNSHAHAPLRVNTGMRSMSTTPATSSRLAHVSSQSELNLYLDEDSSGSTNVPTSKQRKNPVASPTSPVASMSPFSRTSFEAVGFPRLRAKSDLDTATRAEHLREARRKIQAKQQAKEERYARQEIKQRERADNKRAQEAERRAAAMRKEADTARRLEEIAALAEAMPPNSKHNRKPSSTSSGRPSMSRVQHVVENEKVANSNYDTMQNQSPPAFGSQAGGSARHVSFQSSRRTKTAKRKTHGAWTSFILWLRTRLLRMSG
ncbi:hypothetical protein BKA67DRAFT_532406 [Truncatella angustata]|uniref:Uncharacterized protein n=1 Tax=Truncatella angustata TaxID=152316 RepID=A0A9P8URT1_9PEZI|nr:uncharacterized protein BKA67DRAFT_532406 [Truncatella angustata]KAH6657179.1 hypothetical protein BKA67DRAFT_532406 [Truncatella angustata]KAH8198918.1 hypothetical protein TruAng_006926 [Truncatella angustata]